MKIISSIAKDISFDYSNNKKLFSIPQEEFINLNGEYNFIIDGKSLNLHNTCNIFFLLKISFIQNLLTS